LVSIRGGDAESERVTRKIETAQGFRQSRDKIAAFTFSGKGKGHSP
jgi:hypothetical protein